MVELFHRISQRTQLIKTSSKRLWKANVITECTGFIPMELGIFTCLKLTDIIL